MCKLPTETIAKRQVCTERQAQARNNCNQTSSGICESNILAISKMRSNAVPTKIHLTLGVSVNRSRVLAVDSIMPRKVTQKANGQIIIIKSCGPVSLHVVCWYILLNGIC